MKIPRPQRKGFVLMMTLFVLAIVGLLLISLANHSMVTATDALNLRRETERKWAKASCQRFVLDHIDDFLTTQGRDGNLVPIRQNRLTIYLNETAFEILIEDESAKLGINSLFEYSSRVKTAQIIRRLLPSNSGLIVKLRPNNDETSDAINNRFESWGQVFSLPADETGFLQSRLALATEKLTCWSDRINVRTAPNSILTEAIKSIAGGSVASQIVSARNKTPQASASELINATGANQDKHKELTRLLSDRSWCQSVTIQTRRSGYTSTTQLFRKFYTSSIYRIQSYRW